MLYCTKCRGICEDSTLKCPNCKSTNLRQVKDDDYVLLHRADQYTAQRLAEQFDQQGVAYQLEPFVGGWVSYLYDSDVLPTDKMIVVRYGDLPKARELSVQVRDQIDRERQAEQGEENFEEMPFKKAGPGAGSLRGCLPAGGNVGGVRSGCCGQLDQGPFFLKVST